MTRAQLMANTNTETKTSLQEDIRRYNNYVWQRYVDFEATEDLDEAAALEAYARYYGDSPPTSEKDWGDYFLYGILLYQAAARDPEKEVERLILAYRVLTRFQEHTGEDELDIVTDTLTDVIDRLKELDVSEEELLEEEGEETAATSDLVEKVVGPPGMVLVSEGDFLAGTDKRSRSTDSFYIDKYPVTNREYRMFVEATEYRPPLYWDDDRFNDPDQPVVGVSYMDAQQFAKWAGKTLPTAKQWEKAARGTDGRAYPWGDDDPDLDRANYCPSDRDDAECRLEKIGRYTDSASPFGVMDAVGGVWEWTSTNHEQHQDCKVICGASWVDPEDWLGCEVRFYAGPKEKEDILGFRCIKRVE